MVKLSTKLVISGVVLLMIFLILILAKPSRNIFRNIRNNQVVYSCVTSDDCVKIKVGCNSAGYVLGCANKASKEGVCWMLPGEDVAESAGAIDSFYFKQNYICACVKNKCEGHDSRNPRYASNPSILSS